MVRRVLSLLAFATALAGWSAAPSFAQTLASRTLNDGPSWPVFEPDFSACTADPADFGARGDGVADDTRAIQAALDVGGHVCIRRPGVYVVSGALARLATGDNSRLNAALVIRSGTTLTMQNNVKLRLASGSDCYLLRNASPETGDHDIVVEGGQLDGNANGQQENNWLRPYWFGHMVLFQHVTRVAVRDVRSINPSRYAFLFVGSADITTERLWFKHQRLNSDGVHFHGPCSRIVVRDLRGLTNDNMVGFVCGEGLYYFGHADEEFGVGDITDVLVERLYSTWGKEPVRLTGPLGTACRRFVIRDVSGEVIAGMGVHLGDDSAGLLYGCEMTDIQIERINCRVPPGYALVAIDASGAKDVTIRGLTVTDPSNSALLLEARGGQAVDVQRLELSGLRMTGSATRAVRFVGPGVRVRRFVGSDWVVNQQPSGVALDVGSLVDLGEMSGIAVTGGALLSKSPDAGPGAWSFNGWTLNNVSAGFVPAGATTLNLTGGTVFWSGAGPAPLVLYQVDANAVTRVVGSGLSYTGAPLPAPVYVPRGAFTVNHPEWRMAGSGILGTPQPGDRFYNLQTFGQPWDLLGIGPVVFDGENWVRR